MQEIIDYLRTERPYEVGVALLKKYSKPKDNFWETLAKRGEDKWSRNKLDFLLFGLAGVPYKTVSAEMRNYEFKEASAPAQTDEANQANEADKPAIISPDHKALSGDEIKKKNTTLQGEISAGEKEISSLPD